MRLGVELEQRGVLRLTEELDRAAKAAGDLRPAWQAVSDILSEEFEQLFAREGGWRGPTWSRLSPATVQLRAERRLTPIRIGWARGRMATSLIEPTTPYSIEIRRPQEYVRGTSAANEGVSYPSIFERGRALKSGRRQPPRPIIGRLFRDGNTATMGRIADAIAQHILPDGGPERAR